MGIRSVLIGTLTAVVCLAAPAAARAERLCDPAGEDCRAILLREGQTAKFSGFRPLPEFGIEHGGAQGSGRISNRRLGKLTFP